MTDDDILTTDAAKRLIGLADASKLMRGRRGKAPSVETIRRWANPKRGCRTRGGAQVLLRTIRLGGELLTLPEWVEEFERERRRMGTRQTLPPPAGRTDRQRERAFRRAEERLDAMGVGRAAGDRPPEPGANGGG